MAQIKQQTPTRGRSASSAVGSVYPGLYDWLRDRLSGTYVHGEKKADHLGLDGYRSPTMEHFDRGEPVTIQCFYVGRFRPRLRPPLGRPFDPSSFICVSADDAVVWDVGPKT